MRRPLLLGLLVCAASACRGGASVIEGTLAEGTDATHVWLLGEPERSTIDNGAFRLEGVSGDLLDLRFAEGDREIGRMEIRDRAEGTLTLERIWIEDGVAFPSAVSGAEGSPVRINSLRVGGSLPASIDSRATVLAVSRDEDALLVRPEGDRLPDLRVVITPGTNVVSPDGDPTSLRVSFGDTVQVGGSTEGGYVIASEVIVPRRSGRSDRSDRGDRGSAASGASSVARTIANRVRELPMREVERGKGKGKGKDKKEDRGGKGRGKG